MKDMFGTELKEGMDVIRACTQGTHKSPFLKICTVTKVEDGKVYLDNSNIALIYPERIMVVQLTGKVNNDQV